MNQLLFYEKPGCTGNQYQVALLRARGHRPEVRNLLSHAWTVETLRPFFGNKPVVEWFNPSAPAVKSGAIKIATLSARQALNLMLAEPLLICRPLLEYGLLQQSGFVDGPVLKALGIVLDRKRDLNACPMGGNASACEPPV